MSVSKILKSQEGKIGHRSSYRAFLMIAVVTSGTALGALFVSCSRAPAPVVIGESQTVKTETAAVKAPETPPKSAEVEPIHETAKERRTLFEKFNKRRDCKSNPVMCDGDLFEMDIKKEMRQELDEEAGLSQTFCAGGCSKKNALQWSLKWQ